MKNDGEGVKTLENDADSQPLRRTAPTPVALFVVVEEGSGGRVGVGGDKERRKGSRGL